MNFPSGRAPAHEREAVASMSHALAGAGRTPGAALLTALAVVAVLTARGAAAGARAPVGSDPQALAVADLNGDGRLDVVTANQGSDDVSVLLGTRSGTLRRIARQGLGPDPLAPAALAVGDLNRDGPVGAAPEAIAAADLNGDRRLDLVTANAGSGDVSVLIGLGNGGFRPARSQPAGVRPWAVAVADLNRDGVPDLAVADRGLPGVSLLFGIGGGAFRRGPAIRVGTVPSAIVAADLNGDGITDLAMSDFRSKVVWLLAGQRRGGFRRAVGVPIATGPAAPSALAVADLNRDGIPDIAVADFRGNRVAVLAGGPGPAALAAADLTGDGRPDLAVADSGANAVTLLAGSPGNAIGARSPSLAAPAGPTAPGTR